MGGTPSLERGLAVALIAWFGAVIGGFIVLASYENTPGPAGRAPKVWPEGLPFEHRGRPAVVLSVHPRCPCTRATLEQIDRVVTRSAGSDADFHALVYRPSGESTFDDTDLLDHLRRIERMRIHADPDGRLSALVGAETSGAVRVYDADRVLRFHGGITPSRGHLGDDVGFQTVLSLVRGRDGVADHTPTFGCGLRGFVE